jgi:predicted nucleic acid-binding protein
VLETNALASGLLSPYGPCGDIPGILVAGGITPCEDARILLEYKKVLRRSMFKLSAHRREAEGWDCILSGLVS